MSTSQTLLIWLSATFFVIVVGEPPSSYSNSQPWGHIGNVKEEYGNVDSYSPKGVSNSYGLPKAEYGPPKAEYGPPKAEYGPPKSSYGPPKSSYVPAVKSVYGPPEKAYPSPHTVIVVKERRKKKIIKGKYIWVPTIPRLKIIRPRIHYRAPKVKVIAPRLKFTPPKFIWW